MLTFMFGTLGSLILWGIYILITLVVGTAVLKKIAPITFKAVTTGERTSCVWGWFEVTLVVMAVFIFWPVIIGATILWIIARTIWKLIVFKMIGPAFLHLFRFIGKIIPDIKISVN